VSGVRERKNREGKEGREGTEKKGRERSPARPLFRCFRRLWLKEFSICSVANDGKYDDRLNYLGLMRLERRREVISLKLLIL